MGGGAGLVTWEGGASAAFVTITGVGGLASGVASTLGGPGGGQLALALVRGDVILRLAEAEHRSLARRTCRQDEVETRRNVVGKIDEADGEPRWDDQAPRRPGGTGCARRALPSSCLTRSRG